MSTLYLKDIDMNVSSATLQKTTFSASIVPRPPQLATIHPGPSRENKRKTLTVHWPTSDDRLCDVILFKPYSSVNTDILSSEGGSEVVDGEVSDRDEALNDLTSRFWSDDEDGGSEACIEYSTLRHGMAGGISKDKACSSLPKFVCGPKHQDVEGHKVEVNKAIVGRASDRHGMFRCVLLPLFNC